jgi:hypothetical protein
MTPRRAALLPLLLAALLALACGSAAPQGAPAPGAAPAPSAPGQAGAPSDQGVGVPAERMIARSAKVTMAVADLTASVEAATALANRVGGFATSTSVRGDEDGERTATLALRVPAARYDETMSELRRLALQVDEESGTAQDVTEEYVDLGARLRNLEATEQQYLELLKRAQTVEDVLAVQQRLGEVRTQIDQLKGRLQLLQRRVEMSQIELTMRSDASGFRPLRHARSAWASSLRGLEGAIGFLIATWWFWGLIALGWWVIRTVRARRRRRTAPSDAGPVPA